MRKPKRANWCKKTGYRKSTTGFQIDRSGRRSRSALNQRKYCARQRIPLKASATGERSVGRQRLERARLDHELGAMVDVANSGEEDQPFFWQGDLEGVRAWNWKANQHSKAAVAA
jgi:hypothetical protein